MSSNIAIPSITELVYPVLRALRKLGGTAPIAKIDATVIADEAFCDQQLAVTDPRGRPVIPYRMAWARTRLKRAGLVDSDGKGTWSLTASGETVSRDEALMQVEQAIAIQKRADDSERAPAEPKTRAGSPLAVDAVELRDRLAEFHGQVRLALLDQVLQAPPERLEQIILDLLEAMGYTSRGGRTERLGGAGDGGVDGVVIDDPLGIRRLYCQAKRYAPHRMVGPADVREFIGALDIKSRQEGVFVTTSDFTDQARDEADRSSKTIHLINGAELTRLMLEHGIGTTAHQFTIKEVDPRYFD